MNTQTVQGIAPQIHRNPHRLAETIAEGIRRKSQNLPASLNPELDDLAFVGRVAQLHGMLELIELLGQVGVEVPAMVAGCVESEITRLKGVWHE